VVGVSHIATAPHECEGNLIFTEHGLNPYWVVSKLLFDGFDGYSGEIETDLAGSTWTINLKYQKGGIAPRPDDPVDVDRLYEFRIGLYEEGESERKANYLIQPRFTGMQHYETGERISSPFDHANNAEGVNVHFSGSNFEPKEYYQLLPQVLSNEWTDSVRLSKIDDNDLRVRLLGEPAVAIRFLNELTYTSTDRPPGADDP
jgi:hypothetical protein